LDEKDFPFSIRIRTLLKHTKMRPAQWEEWRCEEDCVLRFLTKKGNQKTAQEPAADERSKDASASREGYSQHCHFDGIALNTQGAGKAGACIP
jgi:hypothetical protein